MINTQNIQFAKMTNGYDAEDKFWNKKQEELRKAQQMALNEAHRRQNPKCEKKWSKIIHVEGLQCKLHTVRSTIKQRLCMGSTQKEHDLYQMFSLQVNVMQRCRARLNATPRETPHCETCKSLKWLIYPKYLNLNASRETGSF